jgi:hypothetical protein
MYVDEQKAGRHPPFAWLECRGWKRKWFFTPKQTLEDIVPALHQELGVQEGYFLDFQIKGKGVARSTLPVAEQHVSVQVTSAIRIRWQL